MGDTHQQSSVTIPWMDQHDGWRANATQYLGDEDALICGVKGVSCVALGTTSDADAQFLPWPLFNADLLKIRGDSGMGWVEGLLPCGLL